MGPLGVYCIGGGQELLTHASVLLVAFKRVRISIFYAFRGSAYWMRGWAGLDLIGFNFPPKPPVKSLSC